MIGKPKASREGATLGGHGPKGLREAKASARASSFRPHGKVIRKGGQTQ